MLSFVNTLICVFASLDHASRVFFFLSQYCVLISGENPDQQSYDRDYQAAMFIAYETQSFIA